MARTFLLIFVLLILCAALAPAQPVMAGLKIGAPLNDAFNVATGSSSIIADANDYTLGPFVEVKLPFKFSVEADALYRGYRFATSSTANGSTHASSWDFPIVAKYHLLKGPVKPYVEGGIDFSHLSDIQGFFAPAHNANFGVVLGAGVQINLLVLRISPELRWTGDTLKNFNNVLDSNRNQVAFLVGIGF